MEKLKSKRIPSTKWKIEGTVSNEEVTFKKSNLTITLNAVDKTDTLLRIAYRDKISFTLNLRKELSGFLRNMKILNTYTGSYINDYKDIQYVTGIQTSYVTLLIKDCLPLDIVKSKYTLVKTSNDNTFDILDKVVYKKHYISLINYTESGKNTLVFSLNGVDLSISRDLNMIWTIDDVQFDGIATLSKFKALECLLRLFTARGKLWCEISEDIISKYEDIILPLKDNSKPDFTLTSKIKYGNRLKGYIPFLP